MIFKGCLYENNLKGGRKKETQVSPTKGLLLSHRGVAGIGEGLNMGDYWDDVTAATDRSFDTQREGVKDKGPGTSGVGGGGSQGDNMQSRVVMMRGKEI